MIKVGFVGNGALSGALSNNNEIEIVYSVEDGVRALELQHTRCAEVVVTELVIPQMDGFMLITRLKELPNPPRCIVLTDLKSEVFLLKAYELGVSQYLVKPCEPSALLSAINLQTGKKQTYVTPKKSESVRTIDERLANIFISVGIPAHIKGYQFLREGIKLAVENPSIINSITKGLYPGIARRFDTTSSKVERAIRHAIEVAWNRGKIENLNSLFGVKVYNNNEKPTNGEFIALLADKMLLECIY